MLHRSPLVGVFCLLAACASEPTAPAAGDAAARPSRSLARTCDTIAITGSNINRCDRSGLTVMSPEAFHDSVNKSAPERIGN
jgi:curli biogenesis system outer membrane secretion channel CsgG